MGFHTTTAPRPKLRGMDPDLRRARLVAARGYPIRGIVRRAIMSGQWDGGSVVRRLIGGEAANVR